MKKNRQRHGRVESESTKKIIDFLYSIKNCINLLTGNNSLLFDMLLRSDKNWSLVNN